MHFAIAVVLPQGMDASAPESSVAAAVEAAMAPFDENAEVPPYPAEVYDVDAMRDHYAKELGHVPSDEELLGHVEDWDGLADGKSPYWEDGGLYTWRTWSPEGRWDWWVVGGRWSGLAGVLGVMRDEGKDLEGAWDAETARLGVDRDGGLIGGVDVARLGDFTGGGLNAGLYGFLADGRWISMDGLAETNAEARPLLGVEFDRLVAQFPDRYFAVVDYHS